MILSYCQDKFVLDDSADVLIEQDLQYSFLGNRESNRKITENYNKISQIKEQKESSDIEEEDALLARDCLSEALEEGIETIQNETADDIEYFDNNEQDVSHENLLQKSKFDKKSNRKISNELQLDDRYNTPSNHHKMSIEEHPMVKAEDINKTLANQTERELEKLDRRIGIFPTIKTQICGQVSKKAISQNSRRYYRRLIRRLMKRSGSNY